MKNKNKTKLTIIIFAFILISLIIFSLFYVGNFLYDVAINPNMDKSTILGSTYPILKNSEEVSIQNTFFSDNTYLDRNITSDDNLNLHAYEFNQHTDRWAIIAHGYSSEGKQMAKSAEHFYENGYSVMVIDLRSHGKSEGDYIGMGWDDRLDLLKWVHLIEKENPNAQIVLYGVSMGAATVMNTTGENLPVNVKAAIEDCGYTSTWDIFAHQMHSLFNLPSHPFLDFADLVTQLRAGYSFREGGALDQVKKSTTPTLFIHGSKDNFVPFYMLDELYNAASCKKQKLVINGAGHGESAETDPIKYWNTIDTFLMKYVK